MIVRITTPGPQEVWHRDVVRARSNGSYLSLRLESHPHLVHYPVGREYTGILICETSEDVTSALREELHCRAYHEMDQMRRV